MDLIKKLNNCFFFVLCYNFNGGKINENLLKEYVNNCVLAFNNRYPNINVDADVIINTILKHNLSDNDVKIKLEQYFKRLINEQLNKMSISDEKKYELNEFFNCRISHNVLHIHVVPKAILDDMNNVGFNNFLSYVENMLLDAFDKIPNILFENDNVKSVLAVSPLLRLKKVQALFKKFEFNVMEANESPFKEMFGGKKAYKAVIDKDVFLKKFYNSQNKKR